MKNTLLIMVAFAAIGLASLATVNWQKAKLTRAEIETTLIDLRSSIAPNRVDVDALRLAAERLQGIIAAGRVPQDLAHLLPPVEVLSKITQQPKREAFGSDAEYESATNLQAAVAESWAPELATRIDAALPLLD